MAGVKDRVEHLRRELRRHASPLLRRGQAGDLRPRIRPPARRAETARGGPPRAGHARQPDAARRRPARSTAFTTVTHREPMLSIDNTYNADDLREFDKRVRKLLGKGEPVTLRRRAEDRRRGHLADLRGRRVHPRRHPRRRRARRRRDAQPQDDPRSAADAAHGKPPTLFEARGEVYMTRADWRRINRRAQGQGREAVRQPAQPHRRHAQAARPAAVRRAPPAPVHLRPRRRARASTSRRTWKRSTCSSKFGFPVNPHIDVVRHHRRSDRLLQQLGEKRARPALRNRRHGHQGQRLRPARTAGRDHQVAALGDAPTSSRPSRRITKLLDIELQVGKHGTLTPVAHLEAGAAGGHHGQPGQPAQRRLHHAEGHPRRRHGRGREGGRDHSLCGRAPSRRRAPAARRCSTSRRRARSAAAPSMRDKDSAVLPLHRRHAAAPARSSSVLRAFARRSAHGHRGPGREDRRAAGGYRPGQLASRTCIG